MRERSRLCLARKTHPRPARRVTETEHPLNRHTHTRHQLPQLHVDTEAVNTRLTDLARIRACKKCKVPVGQAVTDITNLLIQVTSLYPALIAARLDAANLRAAIQAALGAAEDGDPDPLGYLRDELPEPPTALFPEASGEWCL